MRSLSPVLRATSVTLTLLPALLALAGCGGTAATAEPSTVLSAPAHAPFLWRVTSPEGQVSHLMGTIHGAVTLEEALPAPHNGLLSTAEAVYVESLVDDQAQLMAFAQRMLQPSEVPLSQKVGAQTFDALAAQLATFPRERLDTLRPWAAFFVVLSVRLTQSLQAHAREAGTDPATPAMDAVILQQARALLQQLGAGACQLGLARAAVVQQHVQRVLDLAHAVGQCAGHHAHGAGGSGETASRFDGLQHGQRVRGQYIASSLHGGALQVENI